LHDNRCGSHAVYIGWHGCQTKKTKGESQDANVVMQVVSKEIGAVLFAFVVFTSYYPALGSSAWSSRARMINRPTPTP
jgi:hypothetical protein